MTTDEARSDLHTTLSPEPKAITRRTAARLAVAAGLALAAVPAVSLAQDDADDALAQSFRFVDGVPVSDAETEGSATSQDLVATVASGTTTEIYSSWSAANGTTSFSVVTNTYEGSTLTGTSTATAAVTGVARVGIDVSKWQGSIDWDEVVGDGISFAIIRAAAWVGERSSDGKEGIDDYWATNASECERLGLPFGAYIYSYATTVSAAREEADYILGIVDGYDLTYPVYIDIEDSSVTGADLNAVALAFCERVEAAGYTAGIYANKNFWTNYLTDSALDAYAKWAARYPQSTALTDSGVDGTQIWQFSSHGSVSGISGYADMNFEYDDEDEETADYDMVYRLYNSYSGEHHFTLDTNEVVELVNIGWTYEGVAWYVPESSQTPVYRLYNEYSGDHHFTTDEYEYDYLASIGWTAEGIAWYSDEDEGVPVYRLYNPYVTSYYHHFTIDENEYSTLAKLGWEQEGIAWYGVDTTATESTDDQEDADADDGTES